MKQRMTRKIKTRIGQLNGATKGREGGRDGVMEGSVAPACPMVNDLVMKQLAIPKAGTGEVGDVGLPRLGAMTRGKQLSFHDDSIATGGGKQK